MAVNLLFADSFSHYGTAGLVLKYTPSGSTFPPDPQWTANENPGRLAGSGCFRVAHNGASSTRLERDLGAGYTTACLEAAVKGYQTPDVESMILGTRNASFNDIVRLMWTVTGELRTILNATPVAVSSGLGLLPGTWYHLGLKVVVHASLGSIEVRVNGVPVPALTATGLNTASASPVTKVSLGSHAMNGAVFSTTDFTDFTVTSDNFCGDCYVVPLFQDGPGAYSGWTPSAGAAWQCVDDPQVNFDTDFITATASGQRHSGHLAPLGLSGSVVAVQQVSTVRKDDAPARTVRQFLRVGSTDYEAPSAVALAIGYSMFLRPVSANPAGGAWDLSQTEPGLVS